MQTVPVQGLTEMSLSAYMLQDKRVCTEAPSAQKVVIVQPLSRVRLFVTPWTMVPQASLSFTISWSLLSCPLNR